MAEHIRGEALVVTDSEGNHYVLTRDVLEQAKATETQRTQLARLFDGEEVSGYAFALGTAPRITALGTQFQPRTVKFG